MRSGIVKGKVQGVMFRQTFVRALLKYGLEGGATNDPLDSNCVSFTVCGDEHAISEILKRLTGVVPLNSWGATVTHLELVTPPIPIEQHQVTTSNVESFHWTKSVEFFL